jgi:hypothetical protein
VAAVARSEWPAAFLLGLLVLIWPTSAGSQVHVSAEERFFRIEWQIDAAEAARPAIVGFVSNQYRYPVQRVQVLVQVVDEAGQVIHEMPGTVGDVPPGGRGGFRLELPDVGARLVVTVQAFEFGAAQAP